MWKHLLFVGSTIALPHTVLGATLEFTLSGTAYQGAPSFSVSAGEVEKEGSVESAAASHIVHGQPVKPTPETFSSVSVKTDQLEDLPFVTVSFLNDAYDGPGLDRNLYVVGITIDGAPIDISAYQTEAQGVRLAADGTVVIASGGSVQFLRPETGWPIASPAVVEPDRVETPKADAPIVSEQITTETQAPLIRACKEEGVECPEPVALVFKTGLQPVLAARFERGVRRLISRGCSVTITGWASITGRVENNIELARQRALYLQDVFISAGGNSQDVAIEVGGETTQFGPTVQNQRAVASPVLCTAG